MNEPGKNQQWYCSTCNKSGGLETALPDETPQQIMARFNAEHRAASPDCPECLSEQMQIQLPFSEPPLNQAVVDEKVGAIIRHWTQASVPETASATGTSFLLTLATVAAEGLIRDEREALQEEMRQNAEIKQMARDLSVIGADKQKTADYYKRGEP